MTGPYAVNIFNDGGGELSLYVGMPLSGMPMVDLCLFLEQQQQKLERNIGLCSPSFGLVLG